MHDILLAGFSSFLVSLFALPGFSNWNLHFLSLTFNLNSKTKLADSNFYIYSAQSVQLQYVSTNQLSVTKLTFEKQTQEPKGELMYFPFCCIPFILFLRKQINCNFEWSSVLENNALYIFSPLCILMVINKGTMFKSVLQNKYCPCFKQTW